MYQTINNIVQMSLRSNLNKSRRVLNKSEVISYPSPKISRPKGKSPRQVISPQNRVRTQQIESPNSYADLLREYEQCQLKLAETFESEHALRDQLYLANHTIVQLQRTEQPDKEQLLQKIESLQKNQTLLLQVLDETQNMVLRSPKRQDSKRESEPQLVQPLSKQLAKLQKACSLLLENTILLKPKSKIVEYMSSIALEFEQNPEIDTFLRGIAESLRQLHYMKDTTEDIRMLKQQIRQQESIIEKMSKPNLAASPISRTRKSDAHNFDQLLHLKEQNQTLREELLDQSRILTQKITALSETQRKLTTLQQSFEELRQASGNSLEIQKKNIDLQHQLEYLQMQIDQLEQMLEGSMREMDQIRKEKIQLEVNRSPSKSIQLFKVAKDKELDQLTQQLVLAKEKNKALSEKLQSVQSTSSSSPFWDLEIFSKGASLTSLVRDNWVFNIKREDGSLPPYSQQVSVFSFQPRLAQTFITAAFNCPPHQLHDLRTSFLEKESSYIRTMNSLALCQGKKKSQLKTFLLFSTLLRQFSSQQSVQNTKEDKDCLNEFWLKFALCQRGMVIFAFGGLGMDEVNLIRFVLLQQESYRDTTVIFILNEPSKEAKELAKHLCQQMKMPMVDLIPELTLTSKRYLVIMERARTKLPDMQKFMEDQIIKGQTSSQKQEFVPQLREFLLDQSPHYFRIPPECQPDFEIVPSEEGDSFSLTLKYEIPKVKTQFNRPSGFLITQGVKHSIQELKGMVQMDYEMAKSYHVKHVKVKLSHHGQRGTKVRIRVKYSEDGFMGKMYLQNHLTSVDLTDESRCHMNGNIFSVILIRR